MGCTLGLLCLAPARSAHAQEAAELEYRVKAAYLLNFTRYTEWPSAALPATDTPINVCVIGRDPFGVILDQTLRGRRTSGRPLRILRPPRPGEALCHVAFLGAATPAVLESWLAALATEPTLTVGESDDFARAGGMIGFVIVDETVRFEINTDAVRGGGLQLSSRLLSLATRLLPEQTP
jgi:hypothetical protein